MRGIGVGHEVDSEKAHAQRLHPEEKNRFRPKPLVLRPPQTDPVVPSEDLPSDLPVVSLPRIPEARGAEERHVECADRDHHEQARASKSRRYQTEQREADRDRQPFVSPDRRAAGDDEQRQSCSGHWRQMLVPPFAERRLPPGYRDSFGDRNEPRDPCRGGDQGDQSAPQGTEREWLAVGHPKEHRDRRRDRYDQGNERLRLSVTVPALQRLPSIAGPAVVTPAGWLPL